MALVHDVLAGQPQPIGVATGKRALLGLLRGIASPPPLGPANPFKDAAYAAAVFQSIQDHVAGREAGRAQFAEQQQLLELLPRLSRWLPQLGGRASLTGRARSYHHAKRLYATGKVYLVERGLLKLGRPPTHDEQRAAAMGLLRAIDDWYDPQRASTAASFPAVVSQAIAQHLMPGFAWEPTLAIDQEIVEALLAVMSGGGRRVDAPDQIESRRPAPASSIWDQVDDDRIRKLIAYAATILAMKLTPAEEAAFWAARDSHSDESFSTQQRADLLSAHKKLILAARRLRDDGRTLE